MSQASDVSWIEPLLAPAALVAKATRTQERSPQIGLALLIEIELTLYHARAAESAWPDFGSDAAPDAPPELQLLAAFGRELNEAPDAPEALLAVAGNERADLVFVATMLAANAYARRENFACARQILAERLAANGDPLERRLLLVHLGLRAAEADDSDEAIARTREAVANEPAGGLERTVWVVANWNLSQFERTLLPDQRTLDTAAMPLRTTDPAISRVDILLGDGLDEYLGAQFKAALVNPYVRTMTWQAQDPVERRLLGALLRADCLGDWNGLGLARRALGRYRILAGLGHSEEPLDDAFDLLRRAGDVNGIGDSARLIVRLGPLATLREATKSAVGAPWTSLDVAARLALLANAADLLDQDEAANALERVLEFVRHAPAAMSAAAALLVVASQCQEYAARRLLELAREFPEAIVLQSLPRALRAVRWSDVPKARSAWLAYVREHVGHGADESLLAEAVAVMLVASEREAIAEITGEAFDRRPTLDTLAVFLEAGAELPTDVAELGLELARASVRKIGTDAATGEFGFGTLSVPRLLFYLLQQADSAEAWQELTDFLVDPAVGITDKTKTLEAMARPETKIDEAAATALKARLDGLTGFVEDLGASPDAFEASVLRVALKLSAFEGPAVMARLLHLTSSNNPATRIEAARTLPLAADSITAPVAITLTLSLTDDSHPDVRAHAARVLASHFTDAEEPLKTATHERLRTLLQDIGSIVPRATVAGLLAGHRAGREMPADLTAMVAVSQLDRAHPSHAVREAATTFLTELAG